MEDRNNADGSVQRPLALDCSEVPNDIWKKAERELGETDSSREKCLQALKHMVQEEKDFHPNMDESFLLRFLRAKKFDCKRAFNLLKMYYSHRLKYPALYRNYSPSHVQFFMQYNIMNFLPYRAPSGCPIWVSRMGRWEPEMSTYDDALRFGIMCMELASRNPMTQICGVVNILDAKGMTWKKAMHFTPSRLICFVSAMQDSFPLRQKETHIVNEPPFTGLLYRLLSPLVKEKTRKRIILHGDDMKSLHKYLPPEILPEDYGGYLGQFENLKFYESLLQSEEMFIQNEQYGYKKKN